MTTPTSSLRKALSTLIFLALMSPLWAQNSVQGNTTKKIYRPDNSSASADGTEAVGNLLLTLKVYNQEVQLNSMELLLANKPVEFRVTLIDPRDKLGQPILFRGVLKQLNDTVYSLSYTLSKSIALELNGQPQYRDVGWETTVEISPNKPITLMKNSDTRYVLTLSAAPEPTVPTEK